MSQPRHNGQDVARRGEELYANQLRHVLEPAETGKFLVIDVDTGDYEVDADEVAALQRAMARNPGGARYLKRIGFPTAHRMGGQFRVTSP